ncbi:MAG TPA: VTT domain-containing protein [Pyrinomonadaceae bacterium]|jgi:membrane-associated protein|nr:VTT domain-containing protein [Pyrinomonadaceae bacterium]
MESLYEILHQVRSYLDPRTIAAAGYVVLFVVVFAETGLAMGFFLPGDSLLVVAGIFAARGDLNVFILLSSLFVAAAVGDAVGFWTGAKLGPRLFKRQKSLLFRPSHLEKAQGFYEKYGGKTIIIARFVPIVRTFAPIVAGAARMPYRQFIFYNVLGGFLWVFSMILSGYFLGSILRDRFGISLDEHIEWVVIIVVALSLLPPVIEYLKARREKKARLQSEKAGDVQV